MAIRPILVAPDPVLKQKSKPVEGPVTDEHRKLMDDMLETMYDAPGIGLAAIQVGEPLRIIVMDLAKEDEPKAPRYFVNPEIVGSDEMFPTKRALSVPEILTVERTGSSCATELQGERSGGRGHLRGLYPARNGSSKASCSSTICRG
jgi:peptide deformylase